MFDLDLYRLLNQANFSDQYIMIKYKKGYYNHYNIDYVDFIKIT
jgi:hypothetical protein